MDNNCKTTQQERFQYMRKEILNLTQQQLADKLQVSQPSIADIESGRKQKIDSEILYKLTTEFLIHVEWLLFGTGEITKYDSDDVSTTPISDNIVAIPFYNAKASAGTGERTPDLEDKDVIYFDARWIKNILGVNPNNVSLIQAAGDSMQGGDTPINDGDLLLVDNSIKEGNNKVFVFREDNDLYVKKIHWNLDGSVDIISFNPNYPVRKIDKEVLSFFNLDIIGKVVWNGSKDNV